MVCEQLPKEPTAPAQARRLLDCLERRVDPGRLEDAKLLVSEVVSNAVEHVDREGEIEVAVKLEDSRLRIEVTDPGAGFTPRPRDPNGERGWGLQFVQRLSDDWGVVRDGFSKVWFELAF